MAEELSLVHRSQSSSSPTLRDITAIVFRQRTLLLVTFCVVFGAITLYGLLAPSYSARLKILVRRNRIDPLVSPDPTNLAFERREISEEDLNSEVELLKATDLLRTVVQAAQLAPARRTWWDFPDGNAQREERAIRRLASKLKVEPIRKTNLITITYSSSDPSRSEAVLRALAQGYLERHQQLHRASGGFRFFDEQSSQARLAMEQAELALMNFTHQNSVVAASLQRDATLQKLGELEAESGQTEINLHETSERVQALQAKFNALPARIVTQVRTADNPELLETLKSKLLELRLKRTELLTKFLPSYRLVQEVEQQIAETQKAITAEELTPVRDETTDQEPTREWAKTELLKAQVDLLSLKSRAAATNTILASFRKAAQQLGDRALKQDALTRDLKTAEAKYLLYANKREEARIGDALDSGGILDVAIAEAPVAPALPAHSFAFFLVLAFVVGSGSSVGAAFVADYASPAFRTPAEITAYLDVPVLASLPCRQEVCR